MGCANLLIQTLMNETLENTRREFSEIALPYLNEIYASAFRMARNQQAAEDLSGDVFGRAWKFFHQFERGTNIRAWLYRILTNTYINEYRKKTRAGRPVELDQYENPEEFYIYNKLAKEVKDKERDPAQEVQSKFAEQEIINAMDRLPEGYRETVILSDLQGLSYEEISHALDVPLGTVRSRLNRGRHQLQKALWDEAVRSGAVTDKKMNPMKRWSFRLFQTLRKK